MRFYNQAERFDGGIAAGSPSAGGYVLPAVLTGFSFNDNSYSNSWTPASNENRHPAALVRWIGHLISERASPLSRSIHS
jgi:hypothetical protein